MRRFGGRPARRSGVANRALVLDANILIRACSAIGSDAFSKSTQTAYRFLISGGLAFVLAGAIPHLGLNEAGKNYGHLARSFQWAASQMRDVLTLMRRTGVKDELLDRSKELCGELAHYKSNDSAGSEAAQKKYTRRINETYPPDYVWDRL